MSFAAAVSATLPTSRQPGQPVLTLAIPTWNRARYLESLLAVLLPQFTALPHGMAELIVSDNCSDDHTESLVAEFQERGLPVRYVRNATNIGSDGNFLQCFNLALGQYVWVFGDDDLLLPNAIPDLLSLLTQADVDMGFFSSIGFRSEDGTEPLLIAGQRPVAVLEDKLGRFAEVVTDGVYFMGKVNALISLLSGVFVNKNRLLATPHPPIDSLNNTNLMQLGWLLPLIHRRMSVLYVWQRLVAYRSFNSAGWGICEVFGVRLDRIARSYLGGEPQLADALMNSTLRYWFFEAIMEIRRGQHPDLLAENFAADLRHVFRRNWRYWLFVWTVSDLPLPLAKAVYAVLSPLNKLTRAAEAVLRHLFRRGRYLRPRPITKP